MKIRLLLSILIIAFTLTSYSKGNETPKLLANVKSISSLDVSGKWVTFSFEEGVLTAATPTTTSLNWDIAFNGYLVKLSGDTSGKGRAAALNTETTNFAPIDKAPEGQFVVDTEQQMLLGYPNTKAAAISLSRPMTGDFGLEGETIHVAPENEEARKYPSVYRPTKWVYVLERANDKYMKFQLTDCYNERAKAVYLTFQYQLSDDDNF